MALAFDQIRHGTYVLPVWGRVTVYRVEGGTVYWRQGDVRGYSPVDAFRASAREA